MLPGDGEVTVPGSASRPNSGCSRSGGQSALAPQRCSLRATRGQQPRLSRRGAAALGIPEKREQRACGAEPASVERRGERRDLPRPGERAALCREATRAPPPEHPFNSGSDGD